MKKGDKITVWYRNEDFINLEGELLDIFDDGSFSVKQRRSTTVFPLSGPGGKKNKYRISLNNKSTIFTYPKPITTKSFINKYKWIALGILMFIGWAFVIIFEAIKPLFK